MTEERYWDNEEEEMDLYDSEPEYNTYVRVNGSESPLTVGANFAQTIKDVARDAGLGKFRVFLNGEEVRPSSAPDTIQEGMGLELRPYDTAGF